MISYDTSPLLRRTRSLKAKKQISFDNMCKLPTTSTENPPHSPSKIPNGPAFVKPCRSNGDLMVLREIESNDEDIAACTSSVGATTKQKEASVTLSSLITPRIKFFLLSGTMFIFFGIHNILQEAMMKVPGFNGVMLSYMEVLGVTICSFVERRYVVKETGRVAPLQNYPLLTVCLLSSSCLSNVSLNYINFPTKVVFRSCKLIPTMIIATFLNKRVFKSYEYVCAIAISLGLVVFAAADWKLTPSFHPTGLILVSLSVVADAILPNAQERLFRLGSSRLEVTYFTNLFTLIAMTVITLGSGDLVKVAKLAMTSDTNLVTYMVVYTFIAYIAISAFMMIVKNYGGVTAVLLSTARKGMTLILSFLLFPKKFSWFYVLGAALVLGGLLVVSLTKHMRPKQGGEAQKKIEMKPLIQDSDRDVESGNKQ